ncbi:hypothetical protein SPHINGOT1_10043 [Sphingomonas sp. T1]|nr:hypothetical protein SPHINGOT1_10043 [Sphingomonas sp. T1]
MIFWEAAQQDSEIGRCQSVTAPFNSIVRQLRRSGAYTVVGNARASIGIKNFQLIHFNRVELQLLNKFNA